ncbi:MAG: carbon-nitrogen family hydrolase [Chloroflexota bacterium]
MADGLRTADRHSLNPNSTTMRLTISLAQLSFTFGDVQANFDHAASAVAEAADHGSDIILLPELWSSGYDLENWEQYAAPIDGGVFARIAALAREHQIAIGGSYLELHDGRAYNTFVLYGPDGTRWGVYRKIHLFRLLAEEKYLGAGDALVLADTPWGPIGLATCYDLRFPEIFRSYALSGARLILLVAEWPERRVAHWTKLLQARAIENQAYVAGVNKVGASQGVKLGGQSAVIDPWGEPIAAGTDQEILLTAEIDLREADVARRYIPVFKDRRPDIYDTD